MAKAIGFTTQYYTLWDINVEKEYNTNHIGQVTHTWDRINYCYLGNLSKTLEKAQEKAIERGCIDIEPNHELYGRNKSFQYTTEKKVVKEGLKSSERSELLIICCSNIKENTKEAREAAVNVMLSKGYIEDVNGVLVISEHVDAMKKWFSDREAFLNSNPETSFFIDKNVDSSGQVVTDRILLRFQNDVIAQYYNGYNYYLPKGLDGKAKRIKNKRIELIDFDVTKECDSIPYTCWTDSRAGYTFFNEKSSPGNFYGETTIEVKDFKIKK